MKRLWLAGLFLAAFCSPAWAQATPSAAAPATAPAAQPAPATAAPAAPAPAGTAAAPAGQDWMNYNPYSGEESDVKNPNRTQEEIITWSQQRATEVMSFKPAEIDAKLAGLQKEFTQQGWAEYSAYLQSSKLIDMVKQQNYAVTTIVNGDTIIRNSGSLAGNYHWLVELPVMVTFIHTDPISGEQQPVAGGEFRLTLQLGRVPANQGVDGMEIESWKIESKPSTTATP